MGEEAEILEDLVRANLE